MTNARALVETLPPAGLTEAVAALWRLRRPGPGNLFRAPEFVRLRDFCHAHYAAAGSEWKDALSFPLGNALEALGLPCGLPPGKLGLALPANRASIQLHKAFEREEASRARRVVNQLVRAALGDAPLGSREAYLNSLG